ncbi:MAG: hypothetical protein PVH85_22525 [Desulfobacterales bacterium]|jgi:hypothetical protein
MSLVVYNPTSGPAANNTAFSPRVKNLQGGVLGVLDNSKTNSDTVLNQNLASLGRSDSRSGGFDLARR